MTATAGAGGAAAWFWLRDQDDELDIELPPMPPPGRFVHPYEGRPYLWKVWFCIKRSIFLAWTFYPLAYASAFVLMFPDSSRCREKWLKKMLECTQQAGAAFLKFGQWLSMRPDMFPPDVIETLSKLRSDAPSHSAEITRDLLQIELGRDVDALFVELEDEPIASGSVGQVHRGLLRKEFALDGPGGRLREVAVKVQHPGVIDSAFMDLDIIWKVIEFSEKFLHCTTPFARGEFDEVIRAQLDFTREAYNLQKFAENFRAERKRIRFPKVSPTYVTPRVLVETWAEGKVISHILEDFDNFSTSDGAMTAIVKRKRDIQSNLCSILYDLYMKMLIRDNFVHGDLHGGNVLYSERDKHVTVIDAGIATTLDGPTKMPFATFLHALCSGHTDIIVDYLQRFNQSTCTIDVAKFREEIQATMDKYMGPFRIDPDKPVNAADMFGEVMFAMQRHNMLLKGDVASTLFTISISEGLIRQLDPAYDVARGALPYIIRYMPKALAGSE